MNLLTTLCAAAGCASIAAAQGDASWLWSVATQDGDGVVEPGETATITLSVDMVPAMNGEWAFIGGAFFDTLGGLNADQGTVLHWQVLNELDVFAGDTTTTDGVSLFDTSAGQLYGIDPFVQDNPVDVFRFEWMAQSYSMYEVEYETLTASIFDNVAGFIDVWAGPSLGELERELWSVSETTIQFQVVPSPGAAVVLLGSLAYARRRSRGSD